MIKKCIGCDIEFTPKWIKSVYCSISCSKKGSRNPKWKGGLPETECPTCKKMFIPVDSHVQRSHTFCSQSCSKIGVLNPQWKGSNVGYAAIHGWVERHGCRPDKCDNCGALGNVDAANISGEYKRDISDWEWLCRRCHMAKDGRINNLMIGKQKRAEMDISTINEHLKTES